MLSMRSPSSTTTTPPSRKPPLPSMSWPERTTVLRFSVATVYNAYHRTDRRATTTAIPLSQADDPLDVLTTLAGRLGDDTAVLEETIAPAIREAIIIGALPGGMRLSELQVARRLDVSRTPVRRALNQLAHEGLVVIAPHVGASVRAIRPEDVEEIYEVRIALEVLAVKLLIARLNPVGRAELMEAMESLRGAATDADAYAEALDAFHLLIMRLARNRTLVQMYQNLVGPIRRFRRINLGASDRVQRSLRANLRVARAMLASDSAAATLMEEHLKQAAADVIALLRAQFVLQKGAEPA